MDTFDFSEFEQASDIIACEICREYEYDIGCECGCFYCKRCAVDGGCPRCGA